MRGAFSRTRETPRVIRPELALLIGVAGAFGAFAWLRGSRALCIAYVVGYLLLPSAASINFSGLPPIDKMRAIWLGAVLGTLVFQIHAFSNVRWHIADAALLGAVLCAGYTSLDNELGVWDGLSSMASIVLTTALPYGLARIHLRRLNDVVFLAKMLFWGAVLYAPLAVWEFRMSPQFHNAVYGYFPHSWMQQVRWGFYRPVVFLMHGLSVAGFFSGSLLIGFVLWRRGLVRWTVPFPPGLALPLIAGAWLCTMSFGPWFAVPAVALLFWLARRWRWTPTAVAGVGVVWLASVFSGGSTWNWIPRNLAARGAPERAASFQYRLDAMSEYSLNIRMRPWFGHGGFGRGRIERRATDSAALGHLLTHGFVGAGLLYAWMFFVLAAAQRAALRVSRASERDVILMMACLMGYGIMSGIFGTAGADVPFALVGGAATGLAAVRSRRPQVRRTIAGGPHLVAASYVHLARSEGGSKLQVRCDSSSRYGDCTS